MTTDRPRRMQSPWLAQRLSPSIDSAAIDGHRTLWQRLAVGALVAFLLGTNVDVRAGIGWGVIHFGCECLGWLASRRQLARLPGTVMDRLVYLLCIGVATINWSFVPLLYWLSGRPGLQYVAILIASAMLVHAQAFAFRSRALLAIQAGIPAGVLVTLVLVYSKLSQIEWVTAAIGVFATLFYVFSSANANRAAARALDDSREELEHIAYSDALTTLSNRRRFTEDTQQLIEFSRRHRTRFALVLIDLDRFKAVNDRHGHDVGDALLINVAQQLQALAHPEDRIARLGGDEFAVLLADATDSVRVWEFCQRIIDRLGACVRVNGAEVQATSSVGVAIFPGHGAAPETLYKAADIALYAAKNGGRNTWRAFEPMLVPVPETMAVALRA